MRISVVVPVWNEAQTITILLDGLLAQTRRPDEIIVADNGSTDTTTQIVERYTRRGVSVRLVRGGRGLPGAGRNRGAAVARHEWIAFIDAGTQPAPDWLAQLAAVALANPKADAVYGAYQPITDNLFRECAAIAYVPPPENIDGVMVRTRSVVSLLMRRVWWKNIGRFPEHLRSAEDLLFLNALEASDAQIVHAPHAVVAWQLQPTLQRTFSRFVNYSRHNLRAGLGRSWQRPIIQRYTLLILALLPAWWFGGRWVLAILTLWLLMLAARASVAMRRNRAAFPAGAGRWAARFIVLLPLLATLDAATLSGSLNWLLWDKLQMMDGAQDNVA